MKNKIKRIIKLFIRPSFIKKYKHATSMYYMQHNSMTMKDKIKCILCEIKKYKLFDIFHFSYTLNNLKKPIFFSKNFAYYIDFNYICDNCDDNNHNMTPDYSTILNYSINDLKLNFNNNQEVLNFIDELEKYLDKYIQRISKTKFENKEKVLTYLENIKTQKCDSFIEALQRILFFNQIFWQLGYKLCGLGRLDYILEKYYLNSLNKGEIDKTKAKQIIMEFYQILNSDYYKKSGCLSGDTGQIIVIGGIDDSGNNVENDLTYLFIETLKEFSKPDPKLFLRVNKNTSNELLKLAVDCMATGIGSPMLSNDDVIIPKLIEFGYDKTDSWNYVTAACWEPSPCGNSIDLNNVTTFNLLTSLNESIEEAKSVDELENLYYKKLGQYLDDELDKLTLKKFNSQPYLSLFIKNCRETGTMISDATPKYKNLGVTTLGISNVVNSILNLKKIVNEQKNFTFEQLKAARQNNFHDENILQILKSNNKYGYCSDNKEAIELTNKIVTFITKKFSEHKTYYSGNFKFGLSAPSYVENGKNVEASFDGRRNGDAFNVHISSIYNTFLDIMDFATKIDYTKNCINGNVIDYILSTSYMKNNIEKFTDYLQSYIEKGIYQIQINVIDSKTLIAAKNNPELYKNLIVRVWGFSAYFNDLPEEYKDLLIKRTIEAEKNYG